MAKRDRKFMFDVPSHFNWNLYHDSSKTFSSLKHLLEEHLEHNPGQRTIESYLFMAYLFMSDFKNREKEPDTALSYLQMAIDEILRTTEEDSPARIGFMTVALANEAIIALMRSKRHRSQELEHETRRLISLQTNESQIYVKVIRAFALSRLGMNKYKEAEDLYREALVRDYTDTLVAVNPEKSHWLFALALMIGRRARHEAGPGIFIAQMEEEIELFEKILEKDPTYVLASAHLALCYSLKGDTEKAKYHSFNAIRLDPNNPSVLRIAGQALRKEKCFDEAMQVYERCENKGAKNTYFYHHWGLVFRDKYYEQKHTYQSQRRSYPYHGRGQRYNIGRGYQTQNTGNRGQSRGGFKGQRRGRGQHQDRAGGAASRNSGSTMYQQSDHGILQKAIAYFTQAIECDKQNCMARLDRARSFEELHDFSSAQADYETLVILSNVTTPDCVTIHYHYGLFLKRRVRFNEALDHFGTAIENHCMITPSSALRVDASDTKLGSGKPVYKKQGDRAMVCYTEIAEKMVSTGSPQQRIEGFKCLAKTNLIRGRYALSRDEYKESLLIETNCHDIDALTGLVDSLLHLKDFGEAEQYIETLAHLQYEDTNKLRIKARLLEGDFEHSQGSYKKARAVFTQAAIMGSLEACEKLLHSLSVSDDDGQLQWEFRSQCATIIHCYHKAHPNDIQEFIDKTSTITLDEEEEAIDLQTLPERVESLVNVNHEVIGNVRKAQLDLEQSIIEHDGNETVETLRATVTVLSNVHKVLEHSMVSFKDKFYPNCKNRCPYFYVRGREIPMAYEEVKVEVLRRLDGTKDSSKGNNKSYKWIDFEMRFPNLLDYLVKIQPGCDSTNNWFIAVAKLDNLAKHSNALQHDTYDIPVVVKAVGEAAKGAELVVPAGNRIFGQAGAEPVTRHPDVDYECFGIRALARKAATEVEHIVAKFYAEISFLDQLKQPNS